MQQQNTQSPPVLLNITIRKEEYENYEKIIIYISFLSSSCENMFVDFRQIAVHMCKLVNQIAEKHL